LRAPIPGSVVERDVTIGERVSEDSTLFTIMDLRRLYVDAQLYERDIARVKKGQRTEVTVSALPDMRFEGSVVYIGQTIDPSTRTLMVRTLIDNPRGELRIGMFARVKIFTGNGKTALCVPLDSVLEEQGESFVFVPAGDSYRLVAVKTGARDGHWVEIIGGLAEGDVVVAKGSYGLYSMLRQSSVPSSRLR